MLDPNHILGDPKYRKDRLLLEAAWRFQLIAPLVDPNRSKAERQGIRKWLLAEIHQHPWLGPVSLSARSLRRWCQQYRTSRLAGLTLKNRCDLGESRALPEGSLEKAKELLVEDPRRTIPMVVGLLSIHNPDWAIIARSTLDRHLRQDGCYRGGGGAVVGKGPYGMFEARDAMDLWQGDVCHGPVVKVGEKEVVAKIVSWIDDHSRFVPHLEAFADERLPALETALSKAILKHGAPLRLLVDNGKIYSCKSFTLACSQLGIHKIHSSPYHPESKGKQERFFRHLRENLLREVENAGVIPIEHLNRLLISWLDRYHDTVHGTTHTTPRQRFRTPMHRPVTLELLNEAFLQWDTRTISSQGKIEFAGQDYFVDPSLANQKVIIRYDPYDLSRIIVWRDGHKLTTATPETLLFRSLPRKKKVVEKKRSKLAQDYLDSIERAHQERLEREMNMIEMPEEDEENTHE